MHNIKKTCKTFKKSIKSVLCLLGAVSLIPLAQADNTDHYVDCSLASNGTGTISSPWNNLASANANTYGQGDQLLIKRDSSCIGQLAPSGSGAAGNPFIINAYGTGNKPLIAAQGNFEAAVYLYNQEYIEIHNLEVTNSSAQSAIRFGVLVELQDIGVGDYYRLTNLEVHDVNGSIDFKENGGIVFRVSAGNTPTKFDDVILDGNNVYSVDRSGILINSHWNDRPELTDGGGAWYPSTNFIFRNNTVADIGGDGLVPHHSDGSLLEYNVVHDFNMRSTGANVGLWCWNCDNIVYQFNEVYHGGWNGNLKDSQAFDIDGGNLSNIYQYNYSHDNKGGMVLICGWQTSTDNIVRYNISQNDGDDVIHLACDNMTNTQIYNNTVYMDNPVQVPAKVIHIDPSWLGANGDTIYFYNNLFHINSPDASYVMPADHKATFDSNLFYGLSPSNLINDPNMVITDPKLVNPGSAGLGINTVDGYKISAGSAAIDAGIKMLNNGGFDFWGNSVHPDDCTPDIGAHQFSESNSTTCTNPPSTSNISQVNWSLHYVDSEETVAESTQATNAFDGDDSTIWHTEWSQNSPSHPHEIQINLGDVYDLTGLSYLPRQGNQNGNIKSYEIYLSTDGVNWGGAVAAGDFTSGQLVETVTFASQTAQYVRFRSLSEVNGNIWANAAEINIQGTINTPPLNLALNPSFEDGSASWNIAWYGDVSTDGYVGTNSAKIGGSTAQGSVEQTVSGLTPNTTYTLSAWLKTDSSDVTVVLGAKNFGGSEVASSVANSTSYQQRTITFTTGATSTSAIIYIYKNAGDGFAYGDEVELTEL